MIIIVSLLAFGGWMYVYNKIWHPLQFKQIERGMLYDMWSDWEVDNSEVVNAVAKYCYPFDGKDQIECVVSKVGKRYDYVSRGDVSNDNLIKFSDDLDDGYLCRDIHLTYLAIFKRLGYFAGSVFTTLEEDNETTYHVYTHVYLNEIDCHINLDRYFCW